MSTTRRKILYVVTKSTWGGAQRYVYDLAVACKKFCATQDPHCEVSDAQHAQQTQSTPYDLLLTTHYSLPPHLQPAVVLGGNGFLVKKLREHGIRTVNVPRLGRDVSIFDDMAAFFSLFAIIRTERPDVIHLNSSKAAALGTLAARLCSLLTTHYSLLTIFTVHGWPFREERGGAARFFLAVASWFTALLANSVIVVSKKDFEIGKRMPFVGKKLHLIPNGLVEPIPFISRPAVQEFFRQHYSLQPTTYNIVTIAELHPNKGLPYLIRAMTLLRSDNTCPLPPTPYNLFIIGEGEERRTLEKLIKDADLQHIVFLTGHIENAARYLPAFDLFVLPSVKEGMPYVLLEALAAELPIVMTDASDPEPITAIGGNTVAVVETQSERALADAILGLSSQKKGGGSTDATHCKVLELGATMLARTFALYT